VGQDLSAVRFGDHDCYGVTSACIGRWAALVWWEKLAEHCILN
jgi:hypothetical protein